MPPQRIRNIVRSMALGLLRLSLRNGYRTLIMRPPIGWDMKHTWLTAPFAPMLNAGLRTKSRTTRDSARGIWLIAYLWNYKFWKRKMARRNGAPISSDAAQGGF